MSLQKIHSKLVFFLCLEEYIDKGESSISDRQPLIKSISIENIQKFAR